jgi:hypothetical protein
MSLRKSKTPPWLAASLRFTLLAVIMLLLFAAAAPGQSGWPPPMKIPLISPPSHPKYFLREDNFPTPPTSCRGNQAPPPPYVRTASGWARDLFDQPRTANPDPARPWCPLAPASAFSLQDHLRKYLETWPTPGSTGREEWPEDAGDSEEDLD